MFGFTARTRTCAVFGEYILDALSMAAEVEPLGCVRDSRSWPLIGSFAWPEYGRFAA
jgi:hypothetical protein